MASRGQYHHVGVGLYSKLVPGCALVVQYRPWLSFGLFGLAPSIIQTKKTTGTVIVSTALGDHSVYQIVSILKVPLILLINELSKYMVNDGI